MPLLVRIQQQYRVARGAGSMTNKLLIGAFGIAVAGAVPAAAQYYPSQPYYPQQGVGGVIGAIINGYQYGQYPYGNYGYNQYGNRQYGIDRCARAVEQRLNGGYSNGYGNWGYQGQNYRRYRNFGRVEGITRVEKKSYGFKVTGVASSGWGGYQGYNRPGYGTYGYQAGADLSWTCKVYRSGQIRDIDVRRRAYNWQGY
jgi:hypothetical protein